MRVVIVTQGYPPYILGGAETQAMLTANNLSLESEKIEVFVLTRSTGVNRNVHNKNLHVEFIDLKFRSKLEMLRKRSNISGAFSAKSLQLLSIYDRQAMNLFREKLAAIKPDVVHFHKLSPAFSLSMMKVPYQMGIPFVYSVHDMYDVCSSYILFGRRGICSGPNEWRCLACSPMRYLPFRQNLIRQIISKADKIIVYSRATKKMFEQAGYSKNKLILLPPFVMETSAKFNKRKSSYSSKTVLYVGRLAEEKGVDILLRSFVQVSKAIPKSNLIIAGSGPDDQKLKNLAKDLGIQDSVCFTGIVPHKEISSLYLQATVVVVPSICHENFPMVPLESMRLGIPVIGSSVGGINEVIKDQKTGLLVKPGNSTELAKAIILLLKDIQLRHIIEVEGYQFIYSRFSNKETLNQTIRLYQSLKISKPLL